MPLNIVDRHNHNNSYENIIQHIIRDHYVPYNTYEYFTGKSAAIHLP